jgi:tetratricopeptide (TPR) repeat protein
MPTTDSKIPVITSAELGVTLVDSSTMGAAGPGGDAFQQAIQCSNSRDARGAISAFEKALTLGLDPLRQGYAHANLGALKLKRGDLAAAAEHLLTVLAFKQALYESVHDAAQYLSVILSELGRLEEARALQALSMRTQAKLGYSLSPSVAEEVRQLVRRSQH